MDSPRRYLIAYDVSSDGRRDRMAKVLESFGDRVQYSVFLVDVRPAKLVRLRARLEQIMSAEDSILLADLGVLGPSRRAFEFLGRRREITERGPIVL